MSQNKSYVHENTKTNTSSSEIQPIWNILSTISSWQKQKDNNRHGSFEKDTTSNKIFVRTRPFVTLTYAQTLDGMIATKRKNDESSSSNLKISCDKSLVMTHGLRSIHDAILIGGTTLSVDNPRLNNRLWKTHDDEIQSQWSNRQPYPVVLDTELRHVLGMLRGQKDGNLGQQVDRRIRASNLIICCSQEAHDRHYEEIYGICKADCNGPEIRLLPCTRRTVSSPSQTVPYEGNDGDSYSKGVASSGLDIRDVLQKLRSVHGIQSIMVEGGASVLSSFALNANELVDCVCITISPSAIGGVRGISAFNYANLIQSNEGDSSSVPSEKEKTGNTDMLRFDHNSASWTILDSDCIFLTPCSSRFKL